jgi:HK97 family phage major capsid protein
MTLAEKIAAARAALVAKKDALQALTNKMTGLADGTVPDDADIHSVEELSTQIEASAKELETLLRAEAALARSAQPAGTTTQQPTSSQQQPAQRTAPMLATRGHMQRKPDISLFVRSAIAAFEAHETHVPIPQIIERRWPGQDDLMEVSRIVTGIRTRAAQDPAMTFVPEWAGALVRETLSAFMDLLQPESIVPRIPMQRLEFNGGILKIPSRLPYDPATDQSLSAAFRKEGMPIRVGAARMASRTLRPYTMGVIGTFTMEMLEASIINFEQAVQRWMIEDTAITLDRVLLDDAAEVADTRPAGIANGIAAEDTAAASGTDPASIQQDLRDRVTVMTSYGLGRRPVWIMNPQRAAGLTAAWNAVGLPAFPSMAGGTLMGYPVIVSTTVPADTVFLVDAAELAFAGGTPKFNYSDQAALVEQDGLPFVDGANTPLAPLDTGTPARSLWQTYSGGIRAVWEVSWARLRDHSVQVITGVAW